MRRLFVTTLLLITISSCGQKERSDVGTPVNETPEQFTARQLELLDGMAAPEGTPNAQWEELKSALRTMLSDGSVKATLAAPVGDASAAVLDIDPGNQRLLWDITLQGDYDQNGEVNVSDLTPLGAKLGQSVPADPDSNLVVIDGDGNGLLTIADLTPLGANLGRRVQSYNVYRSPGAGNYPESNGGPNGAGAELLGTVPRSAATGNANATRLHLEFVFDNPDLNSFYWVRPNDLADGSGADGTPSNEIYGGDANFWPEAKLAVGQEMAFQPPYEQTFSFVGSHDPDGTITEYALDADGDGTYDYTASSDAPVFHTFTESGLYLSRLRVTDDSGATGFATAYSEIRDPDNLPPIGDVITNLAGGPVPLSIDFDASFSDDPDGEIVLYEWDYDLDDDSNVFTVDYSSTEPTAQFTFENAGSYLVYVRVTDNGGHRGTGGVLINANDGANQAPVSVLTAFPQDGNAPLEVHFNGSSSSDVDGEVIAYHWDFDSDGFVDKVTTEPEVDYIFAQEGMHSVTLFAEDNDHTLATGDGAQIEIFNGWNVEQLNTDYVTSVRAIPTLHVGFTFRPMLAWTNLSGELYSQLMTQAVDGFDAPELVHNDVEGWAFDLRNVQFLPAIAYNATGTGLKFTKAVDTFGSAWGAPVTIMGLTDIWARNGVAMEIINGNPAVMFLEQNNAQMRFARATDVLGSTWPEPAVIASFGEFGNPLSPGLLDGADGPQLVVDLPGDGVHFYNSQDANGVGWNPDVFVGSSYAAESTSAVVGNRPAVVSYFDHRLWFYRATDSTGATWVPPVIVYDPGAPYYFGQPSLAVIDGIPAVASYSTEVGGVIYIKAANNSGTAWNAPETVDTQYNFGTTEVFLMEFYDLPLIAYSSDDGLRTAYRDF